MKTLASLDLLNAWEQGLGRGAAERALILLRLAAGSEEPAAKEAGTDPARWPVGQRDAYLLDLRESVFGSQVDGVASCPECGVQQEFRMAVNQLRVAPPQGAAHLALTSGEYQVEFRLPDSLDLCELESDAGLEDDLSLRLLQSCVMNATAADQPVAAVDLPDDVVQQISERMSQADPQADINLSLECPECSHRWSEPFDIASFLFTELSAWASRTLFDVHQLAAAYGWSETESLSMSPRRRGFYLEMIAG
jgi:hypothetical protein